VDDGSPSLDISLEMLRQAARHGTSQMVATPHANLDYPYDPAVIAERFAELQAANDSGMKLHLGCDFHLAYEYIEDALANPRKYTIAGGAYLLVEFSDFVILKTTGEIFSSLLRHGMRPVITHPERNLLLQKRLDDLGEWVAMGCGIQVTGQSLLGDFGSRAQKFAERLLDEGLVHVVASDAHDLEHRPPRLDLAYERVAGEWGEEGARHLFVENPGAVLGSGNWAGVTAKRKRRFFSFLR
jgi:protein-tyrosine phosphatase